MKMSSRTTKSSDGVSSSFRTLSIYPTQPEMFDIDYTAVPENIVEGKFQNVEQYLDIQFKLLREDFVTTVRQGIASYLANEPNTNIDVYENVRIFKEGYKCYRLEFGDDQKKISKKEESKKFMNGSLLIFTNDDFETTFLAKVVNRRHDIRVLIELVRSNTSISRETMYTMAECCTFFEPYFQVLGVLKTMSADNFPMEKYIIQVNTSAAPIPKYLYLSPSLLLSGWPESPKNLNDIFLYDDAQLKAYKAALTQEFVVVQGPPGTGKTYLGTKIAETLIRNHQVWYRNSPILVISHKNHALDHFVERLIPFTDRIVRVGGQSKSKELEEFNLARLREKPDYDYDYVTELLSQIKVNDATPTLTDIEILQKALVVAMTTTTAARMKDSLEKLKSPIVIVEEAAEVLEAHVVAALTKHCQHLILLGDHKQLKPSTADHTIGTRFHLGISLFERMINNGIQCYQLKVQHRMRPEISGLLKPKIYPFLQDHESVLTRPSVSGVCQNLFFLNHRDPEESCDLTSKKNSKEAAFLVAFAEYLVLNGHKSGDIAILATYSGQVQELKSAVEKLRDNLLEDVQISSLDAFQGQEAEIVLLSLVRSDKIGFLSEENRVCVALSRAKNGFYLMGNMNLLSKNSELWRSVKNSLLKQNAIGAALTLQCQIHSTAVTRVKCAKDFEKVALGGCDVQCSSKLLCGHRCRYLCHPLDRSHEIFKCREVCGRQTCEKYRSHRKICKRLCSEECDPCTQKIKKIFRECGHVILTQCSNNICPHPEHESEASEKSNEYS